MILGNGFGSCPEQIESATIISAYTTTDSFQNACNIYEISVRTSTRHWQVNRTEAEFEDLNERLVQIYSFVPSVNFGSSIDDKKVCFSVWLTQLVGNQQILDGQQLKVFLAEPKRNKFGDESKHVSRNSDVMDFSLACSPDNDLGADPFTGGEAKFGRSSEAVRLDSFHLIKVIGKGSFGKVMLVRKIDSREIFAMKVLAKANVVKRNQIEHTKTERNVLEYIRHPFIVTLRYAFQTKKKLYFVMDFLPGGELFFHLGRAGRFSETRARFYAAEITLALEYLHGLNVVYRDLKPENVLLDAQGHISLTDFGLSKEGISDNTSASSFCGTPEYLAPEIITRAGHGRSADWWSLGALLYEMLIGMPPFYSRNRDRLFHKILRAELRIPRFFSPEAKSILTGLLDRNPNSRIGSQHDAMELKEHPFFASIDWDKLYNKQVAPPFKPTVNLITDTDNFDAEFTNMPLDSVPTGRSFLEPPSGKFSNFTYVNPDTPTPQGSEGMNWGSHSGTDAKMQI